MTIILLKTYEHLKLYTILRWRRPGIFIVNFEDISHFVLVFLLLTLSRQMPAGNMIHYEKDMVFLLSFRDLNYLPTGKILQALELSIINVYLDGLFSNKFFFY